LRISLWVLALIGLGVIIAGVRSELRAAVATAVPQLAVTLSSVYLRQGQPSAVREHARLRRHDAVPRDQLRSSGG
jgi:hypothetical protein